MADKKNDKSNTEDISLQNDVKTTAQDTGGDGAIADLGDIPEDQIKTTEDATINEEAIEDSPTSDDAQADEDPIEDERDRPDGEPSQDAPQMPTVEQPKQSGPLPLVIGGVAAAILGFLAARADLLDNFLPPSMRMGAEVSVANDKIDTLQAALDAASAKIATLEDQITNTPVFDSPALERTIATLGDRIESLEKRPVATSSASIGETPNYDAAFAELTEMAKSQQAEIDRLLNDARLVEEISEAAANAALARAAATRIVAAVESGAPFAAALGDLATTGVDIPDAFQTAADTGVTQLAELQSTAPDAARAALAAARRADTSGGFGSFLQRQLGARSVTPKEGSDPDAVLSRVEAAVREGRLNDALAEADTLPPEAQAAMADWLEQARARLDVTTATEALMQRLAAN